MLGKTIEIFFRFCVILQAFNAACEQLVGVNFAKDFHLSEELRMESDLIITQFNRLSFSISIDTVERALRLTEYFNTNKLILATYPVNPCDNFDTMLEKLLTEATRVPAIGGIFLDMDIKVVNFMRRIILSESTEVIPTFITNGNGGTPYCIDAMKRLADLGLGTILCKKSANHRKTVHFTKIKHENIADSLVLGTVIQNMGLNLSDVLVHLLQTENNELASILRRHADGKRPGQPMSHISKKVCNTASNESLNISTLFNESCSNRSITLNYTNPLTEVPHSSQNHAPPNENLEHNDNNVDGRQLNTFGNDKSPQAIVHLGGTPCKLLFF